MSPGLRRRPQNLHIPEMEPATLTTRRRRLIHEPTSLLESQGRERLHSAGNSPQTRGQAPDEQTGEGSRAEPLREASCRGVQNPEIVDLIPVGRQGVESAPQVLRRRATAQKSPEVPTAGKVPRRSGHFLPPEHSRAESEPQNAQSFRPHISLGTD